MLIKALWSCSCTWTVKWTIRLWTKKWRPYIETIEWKNDPKTKSLPLFMTFNLRYSLHKLTDELNRSVPFLHTDNARFVLSVWSKTPTFWDEKKNKNIRNLNYLWCSSDERAWVPSGNRTHWGVPTVHWLYSFLEVTPNKCTCTSKLHIWLTHAL